MATEIIKVPDIGDIDSAEIIEITVKVGDSISEDDTVIVVESDKASMEVPASKAGTVSNIKVKVGDRVSEGDEILYLDAEGSESTVADTSTQVAAPSASSSVTSVQVPDIGGADAVEIIELLIQPGDHIEADQAILVLESDKASMEVPSPLAGEVVSVKVAVGDKVSEGDLIIEVKSTDTTGTATPQVVDNIPASTGSASTTIRVPDIGGSDAVEIIEILVAAGDQVEADQAIVVLESDKASMEVPCPIAGQVERLIVKTGDRVAEGDELLILNSAEPSTVPQQAAPAQAPVSPEKPAAPAQNSGRKPDIPHWNKAYEDELTEPSRPVHAGPAVRRLAREFGVDLAFVQGTGPKTRILKEDVAEWVKKKLREPDQAVSGAGIPAIEDQDFSKFGDVETIEMNRIQQITAQNMVRNWLNIPHVTQFDEADTTELEAFRQSLKPEMEKRGVKLSALAFVVKACASALNEYPNFNRSITADGKHFVQKHYCNIGIAVDTPKGLIVPVILDADKKSVWQIAEEIIDLATRGRKGQVKPNEMQGGCFTISSLGGLGGTAFTPIVNAPEVAILGLSNNQIKPHWNGSEFVPRTFTPLSLSYDHRAINGADAAKFTSYLSKVLSDIRNLVL